MMPRNRNSSPEPSVDGPPLRRFRDTHYEPLCASLAEIRHGIDGIDLQVVQLLAQRAMLVKDAARFKASATQVAAPARQAEVFSKVRALAFQENLGFEGFEDVIEQAYRTLVAAFIAQEQRYFNDGLDELPNENKDETV
jgi:isochorismate pyruvate lyase